VVKQTLGNLSGSLQSHAEKVLAQYWVRPNKRIFNNAQISDHFAIIPTASEAKNLDEAETKIYDMVARRFVAVFFPSAEFDVTTRYSQIKQHKFKTEGKVLTAPGWLEVYGRAVIEEDSKDGKALPALKPEDRGQAKTLEANLLAEATKPPPRYTEATLLSAMETAGKLVDDEELADAMKELGMKEGFDVALEMSGSPKAMTDLLPAMFHGGKIALLGIIVAVVRLKPAALAPKRDAVPTHGFEHVLEEKYYVDEIYDDAVVKPLVSGSRNILWTGIDRGIIDSLFVNGSAVLARGIGWVGSQLQSGETGAYAWAIAIGALVVLGAFTFR